METLTLVNKRRRHRRRRNPSFGSINKIWRDGTRPMTMHSVGGGLMAGWAATGVPGLVGWSSGYKGILAAGATAVLGTVVVGRMVSNEAAVGFGIVGATIVVNRLLKAVMGMGVPYISDGLRGVFNGIGAPDLGVGEEEIFGADTYGISTLEPTYLGYGTY